MFLAAYLVPSMLTQTRNLLLLNTGDQAACDQCVIDNCNDQTQACTGVPREFIPRG